MKPGIRLTAWLLALAVVCAPASRGEIVEEIVALVDGDIVTKSEYDQEEAVVIQDVYRRFTGPELDAAAERVRSTLLMDMIDRRILVRRASRMFDTDLMANAFYDGFRRQQGIETDEELKALLDSWGMSEETLRRELVKNFAPDEVVRFEVSSRVSVADHEVEAYFNENPDEFRNEDVVQLREIVLLADSLAKKAERRAEIDAIHASLSGETFSKVASEVSEAGTKDAGGLLGEIKRGDLSESLEEVAFGLEPGQFSAVNEMPYGFHILFSESKVVGTSKTFEDVREELRMRLEDERFSARLSEFMVKARGESEWCVKEKYAARLARNYADKICEEM